MVSVLRVESVSFQLVLGSRLLSLLRLLRRSSLLFLSLTIVDFRITHDDVVVVFIFDVVNVVDIVVV